MTNKQRHALYFLASLLPAAIASAAAAKAKAPAQVATTGQIKAAADALLQAAYPADGPGASVIITRGGRTLYAAGRGFADVAGSRPLTPDSVFRIGSITKQFTATAVLQLVGEGKLSLDDRIGRFFPAFARPGADATVRQLLNHSSGIQDYSKIPRWIGENRGTAISTEGLVALIASKPSRAAPGQAWEYNNSGYVMLGAIIEKLTGRPWHEAVEQRVARPLGLATLRHGVAAASDKGRAFGYTETQGVQQLAPPTHMSVPGGSGALVGSVRDLAVFARALHEGKLVKPALYREMTTPARLADGSTQPYGFGLRLKQIRDRPAFEHGGALSGYSTASIYIPGEDIFVAVFANSDDPATEPARLLRQLATLALGQPLPSFSRVAIDLKAIEPLFGTYSVTSGPPRYFFAREGKLFIARGEGELELLPAGDDRFFLADQGLTWLRFVRQPGAEPRLELHQSDTVAPEIAVRTGPVPADAEVKVPAEVLASYVGTYSTEGSDAVLALDPAGQLTIQLTSPPFPLRAVSNSIFIIDRVKSRIAFSRGADGVMRFVIKRGARAINGRRKP